MMGKKKLAEVKAEVIALLGKLPSKSPRKWLINEIESAKERGNRDAQTLEMLCAALERETRARAKGKVRTVAKR